MNNILHLRGQFQHRSHPGGFGAPRLPVGKTVTSEHLQKLKSELQKILLYWQNEQTINGALVSVYYKNVVAKSNRIKGLLCSGSGDTNNSVRGSKFFGEDPIQHVFTHYVNLAVLEESIMRLSICVEVVDREYGGVVTWENVEAINNDPELYKNKLLAKTNFLNVIVDANYVDRFAIDRSSESIEESSIVTLYKTDVKISELLNRLGIDMIAEKAIDETTIRLNPDELKRLREKVPYLISMSVRDLREITHVEIDNGDPGIIQIPSPQQEPVIGVIDTPLHEDVYFKEWVSYHHMIDKNIPTDIQDCRHGTAVSSIIVDGATINPELDDGCGRFRVRHFGVATKGRFSSFSVLKAIRGIVAGNRDIKVWNLSLGSIDEVNKNFISPEAAELDKIQSEYDVIFIVAGTNKNDDSRAVMRIGAPADSINAMVVNAVNSEDNPASYHRVGPVLSFFHKPDVSYYGGDYGEKVKVCTPHGEGVVAGTSFAAPWIARKMAYLIHNMGFSREVAKALVIDAAAGWRRKDDVSHAVGYGVVPKRIEQVVQTPDDEIRFILTGSADSFETYTYNIPIPIYKDKQPFFARATLCYFPKCSRDQGVDYTSTEMDIHFGRVKERVKEGEKKTEIKSLDNNKQSEEGFNLIREENARKLYRKWDNIKHINDTIKSRSHPRKVYGAGLWGLNIKIKERLRPLSGRGLQFGVVVTLKEMNGVNRIDDFIKMCMVRGWVVNQIDVENRFDVYAKAEEEVILK